MTLSEIVGFLTCWRAANPDGTKQVLADELIERFRMRKVGALLVGAGCAIRINQARAVGSYSNTVVGFAKLLDHDQQPIVACLLQPAGMKLLLANSTFVTKVSHSSHGFSATKHVGSILGTDIAAFHGGVPNAPAMFSELWEIHCSMDAATNIARIVEATRAITASTAFWVPNTGERATVLAAPSLAAKVSALREYATKRAELDALVQARRAEILAVAADANQKARGDAIEVILTNARKTQSLGDLTIEVAPVTIAIDIKSKRMDLRSTPKGYDVDKFLRWLALGNRLLAMLFVGIDLSRGILQTRLCSVFDRTLLHASRIEPRWSRRGGRGAVQFRDSLNSIWREDFTEQVDVGAATGFLTKLLGAPPTMPEA